MCDPEINNLHCFVLFWLISGMHQETIKKKLFKSFDCVNWNVGKLLDSLMEFSLHMKGI